MQGMDDRVLRDILERALGPGMASAAFEAFSLPPSVSIRLNPFKFELVQSTPLHPRGGLRGVPLRLPESLRFELTGHVGADIAPSRVGLVGEDTATLGTLRGGTGDDEGEERTCSLGDFSESGGAERSEASEQPTPHGAGEGEAVPWNGLGVMLRERPRFVEDPLFHAGCYYVQDSSAMVVGHLAREHLGRFEGLGRPVRVLDLCAAPGGKSTDLATSLRERFGDGFLLIANEVMRGRASVLCDNIAIWGDPGVTVTSCDPKAFASLEGFFDILVADVPCSGEGMFRKDPKAVEEWSEETVSLCASRQRRILADAWPCLREGGLLVYSTCTFEEAENDVNVEWAAAGLGAEVIEYDYKQLPGVVPTRTGGLLVPGLVQGEGQFVSVLVKTAPSGRTTSGTGVLHPLREGLNKGTTKGKDFIPSADWALSIRPPVDEYPMVELDRETALRYLHRDNIFIEGQPEGYLIVHYGGHPLGFVKNIGRRWNNLHPVGRRIRIDI